MPETVIIVALFGLFIGYWLVAQILNRTPKPQRGSSPLPGTMKPSPVGADAHQPWHHVLRVSPDANMEQIRQAYETLIGQYHPDKVADLGDELKALGAQRTLEINEAYGEAMRIREGDL